MLFVYNLTLLLHFTNNGFSPFSISESIILYFSSFVFDKYVCCNAAMGICYCQRYNCSNYKRYTRYGEKRLDLKVVKVPKLRIIHIHTYKTKLVLTNSNVEKC